MEHQVVSVSVLYCLSTVAAIVISQSRSCQLSYFVSFRVPNRKCRPWLKGIQNGTQNGTSKTSKKKNDRQNSYTCVRACVCECVDGSHWMRACVCVRVSFVVKLCKVQKQMRRHRRRTQNFHTTKIIFSCNPKKKNKKNTLLAFVLDFLALLPFLRIWVAVVLAL